jgi:hypothetical protein
MFLRSPRLRREISTRSAAALWAAFLVGTYWYASQQLDSWSDAVTVLSLVAACAGAGILGATLIVAEAEVVSTERLTNLNRQMNGVAVVTGATSLGALVASDAPSVLSGVLCTSGVLISSMVLGLDLAGRARVLVDAPASGVGLGLAVVGTALDLDRAAVIADYFGTTTSAVALLAVGLAALACHLTWGLLGLSGEIRPAGRPAPGEARSHGSHRQDLTAPPPPRCPA